MVKFIEQPDLQGYPYGFVFVEYPLSERVTFAEYVQILQWVVDRLGPMDATYSRFEKSCERKWSALSRTGFAFMDEDAAIEFKLRWF